MASRSLSLGIGAVAFVLVALVALIVFHFEPAPISGPGSVGQYAAIASGVVAILAFLAGRYVTRTPGRRLGVLDVIDIAALAFAHGVIALLTWTLLAVILEQSFLGATVFALPALIISGAAAAVTAYAHLLLGDAHGPAAARGAARRLPDRGRDRQHADRERSRSGGRTTSARSG